jgi:hypothetical protein
LEALLVSGDDGMIADVPAEKYLDAARFCSLRVTHQTVTRESTHPEVNFLARFYSPHIWWGDPTSCSDIMRQVNKFHLTQSIAGSTRETRLLEKARSFACTDANTPILGQLARRVLEVAGEDIPSSSPGVRWHDRGTADERYPNDYSDWMRELIHPEFDVNSFETWLRSADTLEALLGPPVCLELPLLPVHDCIIDGQLVEGASRASFEALLASHHNDRSKLPELFGVPCPPQAAEDLRGRPRKTRREKKKIQIEPRAPRDGSTTGSTN